MSSFESRGMRFMLGGAVLFTGVGCLAPFGTVTKDGPPILLLPAAFLVVLFFWLVSLVIRSSHSGVTVGGTETVVDFAGIVRLTLGNQDITGAALARQPPLGRSWSAPDARRVVLSAVTGAMAEFRLARRQRVWLVPFLLSVRTARLRLGVRNPELLVDRFQAGR